MGVSIIGCGDYRRLMTDRIQKTAQEFLPNPPLSSFFLDFLKSKDPIHRISNLVQKDVLLLSGGRDELVPSECNADFVQKMVDAPRDTSSRFLEIVDPEAGHTVSPLMRQETKSWFAKVIQTRASIHLNVKIDS